MRLTNCLSALVLTDWSCKALVTLGIRLTYDVHTIDFSADFSNFAAFSAI